MPNGIILQPVYYLVALESEKLALLLNLSKTNTFLKRSNTSIILVVVNNKLTGSTGTMSLKMLLSPTSKVYRRQISSLQYRNDPLW